MGTSTSKKSPSRTLKNKEKKEKKHIEKTEKEIFINKFPLPLFAVVALVQAAARARPVGVHSTEISQPDLLVVLKVLFLRLNNTILFAKLNRIY